MRFLFLLTVFFASKSHLIFGAQHAFVLNDVNSGQILIQEGDAEIRKSPYCSFNILLSLVGFDTAALKDTENPVWPFKEAYADEYKANNDHFPERWQADHYPRTWMKNSCLWFSQALTSTLGIGTLSDYVTRWSYGNQNLEGDAGKANGLTYAWIGSSLRISPLEQVLFVSRFLRNELLVSEHAYQCSKEILFVEELPNGMKLYGKTGGGDWANGHEEAAQKIRWFVGWVEQKNRHLAFAYRITSTENDENIPGTAAKETLRQRLMELSL